MAVDRAEDGDGLRHGPDRGADAGLLGADSAGDTDTAVLADPERRVIAHRMYRALVDRAYGITRDAWAEALPGLRATWEKHVAKYPEQEQSTPRTQPDGSWAADGGRKLGPDQNAAIDRGYMRIREVSERDIIPGLRAVEAEDGSRQLAGFEHRFKGADRLKEKIADRMRSKGRTAEETLSQIPDAVRFTFQYSESAYTAGVRKDLERLEGRGFTQVECRNTWTDEQYKGINSRWQEPKSGMVFEVQFHTQASLEAKELTHKAYERIRGCAQDEERAQLKEFQRRVNSMIPMPPDATNIEDYPPGEA